MLILVGESDPALAAFLELGFHAENYSVDLAEDPRSAFRLAQARDYGAAVLDFNCSRSADGDALQQIRAAREDLPIVLLASPCRPEDRARVLDLGADDLIEKPFAFSELSARLRAVLRRGGPARNAVLRVDDLELNRIEHCVKRAARKIDLTPKEFALLEYLMRNRGRSITRAEIIEHVWNLNFDTMTNVVDVYINYVRKKVDVTPERKLIHTIRGIGYQLGAPPVPGATASISRN